MKKSKGKFKFELQGEAVLVGKTDGWMSRIEVVETQRCVTDMDA